MTPAADLGASDLVFEAPLDYLVGNSRINRRYVAPGAELNTGRYAAHRVLVRNARLAAAAPTLDGSGFMLAHRPSSVVDFKEAESVQRIYPGEVSQLACDLTGADRVIPLGFMLRSAGKTGIGVQPPASEVHVDMTTERATRLAAELYAKHYPDGPPYRRFIASSLWRAFSPPPQDWPLAVCDGASVGPDEGVPNVMVRVDKLPKLDEIPEVLEGEALMPAASVFHFNAAHRWWYFPDMTRDEVLMVKFFDSDHSRTWRAPHTSFRDPSVQHAPPRESIEFRTVAYFLGAD
jgi:hypothetical protein